MTYLVCFSKADRWWAKFLRKGFGHVSVMVSVGERFIWLNPQYYLEVGAMNDSRPLSVVLKDLGYTVLEVTTDTVTQSRLLMPNVLTCVFMTKYILGIRVNGFTPWQLYQSLLKTKDAIVTQL